MKRSKNNILILFALLIVNLIHAQDLANIKYYHELNSKLNKINSDENRIVFMGNSITENWKNLDPDFFKNENYINRGISGETSPQILARFSSEVIELQPKIVIILAGINDIAQNMGPITIKEISKNIFAMVALAKANGIKVILSSVLPAFDFPWHSGLDPAEKIVELNAILKNYALENEVVYLNYYNKMVDDKKGLIKAYTNDGVHPNKKGYEVMAPLVKEAIVRVLYNSN